MSVIALSAAMLCLNPECEVISDTPNDTCPACGDRGVVPVVHRMRSLNDDPNLPFHDWVKKLNAASTTPAGRSEKRRVAL